MTRSSSDTIEPMPCPFCGAPSEVEEVGLGSSDEVRFTVGCASKSEDACMGYQCFQTFSLRKDAIAAWNKRAPARSSAGSSPGSAVSLIARADKYLNTGSGEYASDIMRDMAEFIRRLPAAPAQSSAGSSPDIVALADEIEDSYSGNFVQDILLDEKDRKLIVAALRARSSAASETPLADLIAAKANEPAFRELKERLDANINWPRYLPILKVRPTGVTSWLVMLPSGKEHIIGDEDWQAAVTVDPAQSPQGIEGFWHRTAVTFQEENKRLRDSAQCAGCDGHECDTGCQYPGVAQPSAESAEYCQKCACALNGEAAFIEAHNEIWCHSCADNFDALLAVRNQLEFLDMPKYVRDMVEKALNAPSRSAATTVHYLTAILERLNSLYEFLPDDPRLREHISDEVDWIETEIARLNDEQQRETDRSIFEEQLLDGEHPAPAQPPRQPAEAEKRLVPVHVMGRTRSPSNLPNNSCTGWAPHEPDEDTLPLPSTEAPAQQAPKLGDMVQFNETAPYASEWRGAELKVVSLRMSPDGSIWVSVIEPEDSMAHRGHGVYDGETTDIPANHLSPLPSTDQAGGK